jgi:hypothetical protein
MPKIQIIIASDGYNVKKQKFIDLAKDKKIHIIEPIDETNINIPDKQLKLKLKAQKWWIEKSRESDVKPL